MSCNYHKCNKVFKAIIEKKLLSQVGETLKQVLEQATK